MRRIAAALIGALCFVRGAAAQPPPAQAPPPPHGMPPRAAPPRAAPKDAGAPDLAFLEYLGSWQGDDDEWIAIKEWDQDAVPKGKPGDAAGKPPGPPAQAKEPAPQQAGNDHEKSR
jgi:hypothetical protein